MRVMIVAGARPNFMKVAPIIRAMKKYNERKYEITGLDQHGKTVKETAQVSLFDIFFVHTGQHYDKEMSGSFLEDLGLPDPDVNLGCGIRVGHSHAEQTGEIMKRIEKLLIGDVPFRGVSSGQPGKIDLVLVVGDVNSTLAAALAAVKVHVPVAHVEAGLRAFDMSMPEEVNRRLTDHVSTLLFASERAAFDNLEEENVPGKVSLVGDVMIDSLIYHMSQIDTAAAAVDSMGRNEDGRYVVMTLHRPSNVDDSYTLHRIMERVGAIAEKVPIWFFCHPRTRKMLPDCLDIPGIIIGKPQPYFSFMKMVKHAALVITDSGSLQTETSFLGVPCVTLRTTTERPATLVCNGGTNCLVEPLSGDFVPVAKKYLDGKIPMMSRLPVTWDGCAAEEIVEKIAEWKAGKFYEENPNWKRNIIKHES